MTSRNFAASVAGSGGRAEPTGAVIAPSRGPGIGSGPAAAASRDNAASGGPAADVAGLDDMLSSRAAGDVAAALSPRPCCLAQPQSAARPRPSMTRAVEAVMDQGRCAVKSTKTIAV